MGTTSKLIDKKCIKCSSQLTQFHMKNPFIDDFAEECSRCDPGYAMDFLISSTNSSARQEEDQEDYNDQQSNCDEGEDYE